MKKITLSLFLVLALFVSSNTAKAQAPTPPRLIFGSSPFQDSLWGIDSTFWNVVFRNGPTLSGFTITGINGMAYDPTTYETYVIMKVSGVTGRVLGKINFSTGVCTQVANLGDNFSSLTFDKFGQLYGATGNGATVPESLYKIDKLTGTKTLMYAMGAGADGEIICYNRADDFIYHWSGNATMVMEKMARTAVSYTATNIPVIGIPGGETFGSLYVNPTYFINSTISSNFNRVNPNGTYGGTFASLPDDLRGLVMPPQFTTSATTFCEDDTLFADAGSLQLFDSIIYNWGDGLKNTIAIGNSGSDGASHIYASAGTFTLNIEVDNGFVRDTIKSFTITVNPKPTVTITGNGILCPSTTATFTASGPSGIQWYMNGSILSGETATTLSATADGIYNLIETNAFGCSDSAAVGVTLINVPNPTVTATSTAAAVCTGTSVTLTGGGALTYTWDNSVTDGVAFTPTDTTTYQVIGTDVNGCTNTASTTVIVNPLPVVTANSTADTICSGTAITLNGGGATTYVWDNSAVDNVSFTPSATTFYTVIGTDVNGCINSDSTIVVVNPLPTVGITGTSTICSGTSSTLLGNGATSYVWTAGPSTASYTVSPTATSTYTVTGTDANGCSNTSTMTVTVNTVDATTTTSGVTITANATGSSYLWINCPSGTAAGATTQSFTPTANGSYAVVVTTGSCSDTSACVTISTIGINEYSQNNAVQVYPNPNNGTFMIQSTLEGTYTIVNELGQVLKTIELNASNDFTMNIQNLNPGVYIVTGINKNSVVNKRIVVTK